VLVGELKKREKRSVLGWDKEGDEDEDEDGARGRGRGGIGNEQRDDGSVQCQ